jgi:predicted metal-dependent phosphoesterase TrpH
LKTREKERERAGISPLRWRFFWEVVRCHNTQLEDAALDGPQIDLHCHSTASDGRLTPMELVEKAKAAGLKALALTDHDTVSGLAMFHLAGKKFGVETISGVEISADCDKGSMHIIGLFVDSASQAFRAFLKNLSDGRKLRNPQIVARLNELGMDITMEEVEAAAQAPQRAELGGVIDKNIGRTHIADVLVCKGYVPSSFDAFTRLLNKGQPAYVPRLVASPQEAIHQIHGAGGLAILAHPPYLRPQSDGELDDIVGNLKNMGLDGIEVYYATHTPEQTALCERLAQKHDLLASGGSDFHGEAGRSGTFVALGSGINSALAIPYSLVERMRERRLKKR